MTPMTLPSRKPRSATLPDHSQTSRIPVPINLSLDVDPKTLPSRKRRSATLSDHSQTSRIPVSISLSIYFDSQDPPESIQSVCDTTRPLADFQDSGANKLKLRFRLSRPSRIESVGLRQYQTTRRLQGCSSEWSLWNYFIFMPPQFLILTPRTLKNGYLTLFGDCHTQLKTLPPPPYIIWFMRSCVLHTLDIGVFVRMIVKVW